jgi:ERCC4-type nuclease
MQKEQLTLTVALDSRESAIIRELEKQSFSFVREQLDVGDIVFRKDDKPILLIERKTWSDLDSSIVSKRHQQQRQRLDDFRNLHVGCIIGYILEGPPPFANASRLRGAIENLALKHGMILLPSFSSIHTASMVVSLWKKINTGDILSQDIQSENKEHVAGSLAKKSKVSDCIFYHQLLIVPHVGEKMAASLSKQFKSTSEFCSWLSTLESPVKDLAQIKVTESGRRIGEKCAKRIHDAFINGQIET